MKLRNRTAKIAIALMLALCMALPTFFATASSDEEIVKVPIVEVQVQDLDAANALFEAGLDVLRVVEDDGAFVLSIMVHDFERDYFAANNVDYTVVVEDAVYRGDWLGYEMVDGVASALADPITGYPHNVRQNGLPCDPTAVFNPTNVLMDEKYGFPVRLGYRSATEFYAEMNYLALEYPDIVKKHVLGTTYEGRPLIALEICKNPGVEDGRPGSIHFAGNHAREWPGTEYCMNLAWHLATQYGKNEQITNILDTTRVWLMPITNPDGQYFDMTGNTPGTWRRNRAPVAWNTQGNPSSYGVDLNRNYAYDWGSNQGSSGTAGSDTYRGSAPFSEAETQAIRSVLTNNQIMTSLSGHTWGELIQYPWSYDLSAADPDLVEFGADLSNICLYADQPSSAMYYSNGGDCDYSFATMGTLSNTFEHGSHGFIRPYMGEDFYGLYGALASYNDFYGNQRRIPLTYNYTTAAPYPNFGPPKADLTAPVIFIDGTNFNAGFADSNRFATVAKVQALGNRLEGKILMTNRAQSSNSGGTDAASRTANAAVVRAAQDLGAVAVILCGNTPTGTSSNDVNTDYYTGTSYSSPANLIGNTGDALQIHIPVAGTLKVMCRECFRHSQAGEDVTLTLTSTPQPGGGSIYYHWEKLVGAFLYNIEAAHKYASHIKGTVKDSSGGLIPEATLDLAIDLKSRLWQSGDNATKTQPRPESPFIDKKATHMDVEGGSFDWSVTPSKQPHFADDGYAITAKANGKYDTFKNVAVAARKITVDNVNFVLPSAITSAFDFGKAWGPVGTVTVPFSTHSPDGAVGVIDGAAVTATVGGLPVAVSSLGGGNYTATFDPADLDLGTDSAQLVIDFDGGAAHTAFSADIELACVYVDLGVDNVNYINGDVNYTVSLRDAA
ncbi:MAG: M14 family metallopeptidase, partial [Clostridiales bacterium]|nr:M14 family metallopeptidase [Clostridiales bacterium]